MTPLFKTHFSLNGRSILTVEKPEEDKIKINDTIYSRSVLSLGRDLDCLVFVEDSSVGFYSTVYAVCETGKKMVFGLRMSAKFSNEPCSSKVVFFAKDENGINILREIEQENAKNEFVDFNVYGFSENIRVAIPFYDSFLYKNVFNFAEIQPKLPQNTVFFIERNSLPFDPVLESFVCSFCAGKYGLELTKSIYYPSRKDFVAWQQYKISCNRSFSVKKQTIDSPNMDHCGSREFCWESYIDYCNANKTKTQ
jgi:hypothetical protein